MGIQLKLKLKLTEHGFCDFSNNNTSSTNEAVNTAYGVFTANTQVNDANPINLDNLSDAVIGVFLSGHPNSSQLTQEDLEQIHPQEVKEMDLKWQMAMLTMRVRRVLRKIGRKLSINGNENIGDPRNQDHNKKKASTWRTVQVEKSNSTALVSCDGLGGYD
ncbi:hypothetical protein Tco_0193464 [Tanacetum coccineum]